MYSFNEGNSPETIQEDFPLLKLAQIYGAIAFYLDHRDTIDAYLVEKEREIVQLWAKIQHARQAMKERQAAVEQDPIGQRRS